MNEHSDTAKGDMTPQTSPKLRGSPSQSTNTNTSNSPPGTSNKRKRNSLSFSYSHHIFSAIKPPRARRVEFRIPRENAATAPPLPDEIPPPLPDEPVPDTDPLQQQPQLKTTHDDGWQPVWDETAQTFYFYNRFTQKTQWENPRVPEGTAAGTDHNRIDEGPGHHTATTTTGAAGGYNPAIHGDYDPNADYAQLDGDNDGEQQPPQFNPDGTPVDPSAIAEAYAATAHFNRYTGRFQGGELRPENFNDENKSRRQMNAFFDVDAAANTHDGRSLRKERQERKLTRDEVKAFKDKRKEKKEQKRRAWLRD